MVVERENGRARYGATAMALHWVVFGLVAVLFVLAWKMFTSPGNDPSIIPTIRLHKSIGIAVLALAVLRLVWRVINPPLPLPADMPAPMRLAARATHWLFYLLLIAVPIAGWIVSSSAGISVTPFGLFTLPDLVEKSRPLHELFEEVHLVMALVLLALIVLHVLAGVFHHFVRRDDILSRMVPFMRSPKA